MSESLVFSLLGAVQGLTEFLPISSTGHLILARDFLGVNGDFGLLEDAVLHLATALAVVVYFAKDILGLLKGSYQAVQNKVFNQESKTLLALIAGTIPAAGIGFLLESTIETTLRGTHVVAYGLIAGSIVFVLAERFSKKYIGQEKQPTIYKGIFIGIFQALALIPGMSRSGMVISAGLLSGFSRVEAARFGFLLSFPIIVGAGSVALLKVLEAGIGSQVINLNALLLGAVASFVFGLFAIHVLLALVKKIGLMPFVVYRIALAIIILMFL